MDPPGPRATPVSNTSLTGLDFTSNSESQLWHESTARTSTSGPTTNNAIIWKGLKDAYANTDDDLNELAALLISWNLGELYSFFFGKYSAFIYQ